MSVSVVRRLLLSGLALLPAAAVFCETKDRPVSRSPRRFHAVVGLRPEKANYYFKIHAAVWPSVMRMIEQANIRNFSIAVKEIEGKHYLFSYFEYIGTDYEGDMARVAADAETQRWWKETEPCQLPLPDAKAKGAIWSEAREVFYMP